MTTGDTRNESKRVEAEAPAATAAPVTITPPPPIDLAVFKAAIRELDVTRVERSRIPVVNGELVPDDFDGVQRLARWMLATGMCPKDIDTEAKACLIVDKGLSIGIGATQALESIMVVNNKCAIYGDLGVALIRRSGLCGGIKSWMEGNDDKDLVTEKSVAWVEMIRLHANGDRETIKRGFSVQDARLAGLWGKTGYNGKPTPWVTNPKRMLHWRAFWFAARDGFADVLRGLSGYEEVADYDAPRQTSKRVSAEASGGDALDLPQRPESETATPAAA